MKRPTSQRYDKGYRPAAFAVPAREVEEKELITARTDRRFSDNEDAFSVSVIAYIIIIEHFLKKSKGFLKIFTRKHRLCTLVWRKFSFYKKI